MTGLANVFCSSAGPLLALWAFERVSGQAVKLTSLKDLSVVTVAYCVANALIHHAVWWIFDLKELGSGVQVFWMMVGDLNGALLGAYLLKWTVSRFGLPMSRHTQGRD
jgi:hypothetical protein